MMKKIIEYFAKKYFYIFDKEECSIVLTGCSGQWETKIKYF